MATNKRLIKSNDEAAGGASFNTVLYTANGGTLPVTDVGFQPDLVWVKSRVDNQQNLLTDSVRGVGNGLISNLTLDEAGVSSNANGKVQSFDDNGFTVNVGTNNLPTNNYTNDTSNGGDYVAWCWKAGGAAVTNTDGTITSQVSANTEAGFSIVSYTGNGSAITVGHGLDSAPEWIITKRRDGPSNWETYVDTLGPTKYIVLDGTNAEIGTTAAAWNNTAPTSSVFSIGGSFSNNRIAYCFHSVAGFSKFGSYVGTASTGNFVSTSVDGDAGFEPAFIMIKRTEGSGEWIIFDNKRETTSIKQDTLAADSSRAESTNVNYEVEFQSNGFSVNGTSAGVNASGETYIYMAFANQF